MGSKSEISKHLAMFSNNDTFDNPYDETETRTSPVSIERFVEEVEEKSKKEKKVKNKDKSFASKIRANIASIETDLSRYDDIIADDFDGYLDRAFDDSEDSQLKNNLVTLGRKYARDTSMTAETSEIAKTYSASEKKLDNLLGEIRKDKDVLQKDIDKMRFGRANFKTLSELITTKSQYHSTELQVIKEMNSINKNKLDLQSKANKAQADAQGDEGGQASRALQQIFGMGRGTLVDSLGGYEGISGSASAGVSGSSDEYDDEEIQRKYFKDTNDSSRDGGDIFIKYEGSGVHYVLIIDEDDNKSVIAEDKEGNIITDYPMPSNIQELSFDIDSSAGTAVDNLHREYYVRYE